MRRFEVSVLTPSGFCRLVYDEWGDPKAPHVLVCVHGLTRNRRDFDFLARHLTAKGGPSGWRVVCPDMPGRGDSQTLTNKADYTTPTYAAACAALIARLDVEAVDWLGTSMGGIIGMGLAAMPGTPIRRLVLNDVGPFIPGSALRRISLSVGADRRFDTPAEVEAALRVSMATFGVRSDAQWRFLVDIGAEPDGAGRWRLRYDPGIAQVFAANLDDVSFWPVWDAIACPTLLIRGAQSDILTAETAQAMTTRGPKAELHEIADCGHAPMLFEDDQIALVQEWLERPPSF